MWHRKTTERSVAGPDLLPAARRRGLLQRLLGRPVIASAVDQAAFSTQNFLVLLAALHWLNLEQLGAFTLSATFLILTQTSVRSLVLEPLTIRHTTSAADQHRSAVSRAAGLSTVIGMGGSLVAVSIFILGVTAWSAAFTITLVPVLLQDAWRFALFSRGKVWGAAGNDVACLLATSAVLALLAERPAISGNEIFLAWAAGAATGALLGVAQLSTFPKVSSAWGFLWSTAGWARRCSAARWRNNWLGGSH